MEERQEVARQTQHPIVFAYLPMAIDATTGSGRQLTLLYRVMLLIDVPSGMRVARFAVVRLRLSQEDGHHLQEHLAPHVGPVKTKASERVMPLDDEIIADLLAWRAQTMYAKDSDWVFSQDEGLTAAVAGWCDEESHSPRSQAGRDHQACNVAHVPAYVLNIAYGEWRGREDGTVIDAARKRERNDERLHARNRSQEAVGSVESGRNDLSPEDA